MTAILKIRKLLLMGCIFCIGMPAFALDWPQWRGPERDGISKETGLMKSWPQNGLKLLWEAPLGKGFSCFAVVGERFYTLYEDAQGQKVAAFQVANGQKIWEAPIGGPVVTRPNYPGPRSTPTVDDGRVYALGGHGHLLCLNAETGAVLWKKNIIEDFGAKNLTWVVSMSPLIDGDRLIVNPGESDGNSIVALDKKTGELLWKAKDPATGAGLRDLAGYSSPVIATIAGERQYVFFAGTGPLGIRTEDGTLLWRLEWKTSYDVNAATPIISGDKIFISSGYNRGCALLQIKPGSPLQQVEKIWESRVIRSHFGTPILLDGYLYGYDEQEFVCVHFETGEKKWGERKFGKGTAVLAGGMLYLLGETGNLALVKPSPEKLEIISEFQTTLSKERCWTMPVVANGRLFARDESKMACYEVK